MMRRFRTASAAGAPLLAAAERGSSGRVRFAAPHAADLCRAPRRPQSAVPAELGEVVRGAPRAATASAAHGDSVAFAAAPHARLPPRQARRYVPAELRLVELFGCAPHRGAHQRRVGLGSAPHALTICFAPLLRRCSYTLGGLYLARYDASPAGAFDEVGAQLRPLPAVAARADALVARSSLCWRGWCGTRRALAPGRRAFTSATPTRSATASRRGAAVALRSRTLLRLSSRRAHAAPCAGGGSAQPHRVL